MCRFLVRLLLVHGTLSNYRLARLIKYSFFKNIVFCAMLFFFQFFAAYSGAIWLFSGCFCADHQDALAPMCIPDM